MDHWLKTGSFQKTKKKKDHFKIDKNKKLQALICVEKKKKHQKNENMMTAISTSDLHVSVTLVYMIPSVFCTIKH
jgi:hypothetical protein